MTRILPLATCLALGIVGANARGEAFDNDIDKLCPAASREQDELLSTRRTLKEVKVVTRPALRIELLDMARRDQEARATMIRDTRQPLSQEDEDSAWVPVQKVDEDNLRQLKHIVAQDGFPTTTMVGVDGVRAAFLLTQHADSDPLFQENILRVVKRRFPTGEVSGDAFALLTDRVLTAKGLAQRYGTQFEKRDGDFKPKPTADAAHVNERRHVLGLISLENYSCVIRAVYGVANPSSSR